MWKNRKRTGAVRRKINAEYLKILNTDVSNKKNHEQTTLVCSSRINSSVNPILEDAGSVCGNNFCVEECEDFVNITQSVNESLDDAGSVPINIVSTEENGNCEVELVEKITTESECNINGNAPNDTEEFNISESSDESDSENNVNDNRHQFRSKIKRWAIDKNIPQTALKELAEIINDFIPNTLPIDPRTLLATPKTILVKKFETGEYWHNGVLIPLKKILLSWKDAPQTLSLNINMDGLPIYKSSKQEFWPILGNIYENPGFRPFIIGIYFGEGKPKNLEEYLQDFIDEMLGLFENGIILSGRKYVIKIRCFICDSPARAYIKGVCNFNGKHGCLKCVTVGEYSHASHTVVFPDTNQPERTDEGFRNKIYGAHHKADSPLLKLPIDMVKNFPVSDSLHLIDLGIMKRLLIGWRDGNFGKKNTKWRASDIQTVTCFLKKCKLPSEIHRSVRSLDSLAYWKASEFRSFFYYLSIVILPDVLESDAFSHFLMLYCGITICSNSAYHHLLPLAEELLRHFVEHYKDFYGAEYVTSNVHNILHITAEVQMYGALDTFSAYPFENKLYMIKRMLRSGKNPLSQVAHRLIEDDESSGLNMGIEGRKKITYPYVSKSKSGLCSLYLQNYRLSSKVRDRYLLTNKNEIIEIDTIDDLIKGFRLNYKEDVFVYPIKSSHLGIYKSKCLWVQDTTMVVFSPNDIKCKLVCIPHKDFHYFIPLVHTV